MHPVISNISQRLSLRAPQKESLDILRRVCEIVPPVKGGDTAAALAALRVEYPGLSSFDRDFVSLCFALATGVGKTRLMGACVAFLHLEHHINNFFVLAPNLTIYNKLIADFSPGTPKYVFKGIADFAGKPPQIVTGDNYASGVGIRGTMSASMIAAPVHINIFNIGKLSAVSRMRHLSEYIGESYFEYLSRLPDLVMLMDESHRYRASAGLAALNELNPVLGLEFTATPQVENGGKAGRFGNIIYEYTLGAAIADGFVKEPAVATREDFHPEDYNAETLEKLKLEDGVRLHEDVKVELDIYARGNGLPMVKPFMLVVARDTEHADGLRELMESEAFFAGRYRGKVLTVHSKSTKGSEGDDIVRQLLTVESPDNPVEIVVHVNMLKEGWDVTNLYTIVPLRKGDSRTLVEQSIGRGLRLPFGRRTGVPAVDRLTIVFHDRFKDIVDYANDPHSIIRQTVIIGRDVPEEGKKAVRVPSALESLVAGTEAVICDGGEEETLAVPGAQETAEERPFATDEERTIAAAALETIGELERLKSSRELTRQDVQAQIVRMVEQRLPLRQLSLDVPQMRAPDVAAVVRKTTELFQNRTIDIPRIMVVPRGEVRCWYEDFELDLSSIRMQPVEQVILIQHLAEPGVRERLGTGYELLREERPENYILRGLVDYDDVSYDDQPELLNKLAGQVVARLRGYLKSDEDVTNVLLYHQQQIVELVHSQMQPHFRSETPGYDAVVTRGFTTLKGGIFSAEDKTVRDYTLEVKDKARIRGMLFGGFAKSLYPVVKFDVDPERRFSVVLENDGEVLKWLRPGKNDIGIYYTHDQAYIPDFIVETKNSKCICEIKKADQVRNHDPEVMDKARAAALWCRRATEHGRETDGKPWRYLLIPHDHVAENMTWNGCLRRYAWDEADDAEADARSMACA